LIVRQVRDKGNKMNIKKTKIKASIKIELSNSIEEMKKRQEEMDKSLGIKRIH